MGLFAALLLLGGLPAGAASAADTAPGEIVIAGGAGTATTLTAADLAHLPSTHVDVAFGTEHGPRQFAFDGPLLWTVLDHAHALDPGKPGGQVRQAILITGRDGYTAILAVGEIAPEFEGKQVILAEAMDGKALDQPRIVVPGDHRGGRSVRDVARIAVTPLPAAP